jgi:hydroxymethylglutaryl-CoA reductase
MTEERTSRIAGFYKRSLADRADLIAQWASLNADERAALIGTGGLDAAQADHMVENAVGVYALPLGIATNFRVNERDYLVPMAIEEPSVIAAVSNAARLFRAGGGFTASSDEPVMIGQIQVLDLDDPAAAGQVVLAHRDELMAAADSVSASIVHYGGGARGLEVRTIAGPPPMLIVHLLYDCRDAMGANTVNTALEYLGPQIEALTGGRVNLRILSNLADRRKAWAEGVIPAGELATDTLAGAEVVKAIVEAGMFAALDPYRATTHNKGIMNGIDAVVIATGNDWRAIEAGAHAYAARSGAYTSLTHWWADDAGDLRGSIELPLAVGIVGGATRVHPAARAALKLLGVSTARELAEVIAAVGLAQNLAAIRALATEGIQRGHMSLHARQLAIAAGAASEQVARIVQIMIAENNIGLERAAELVQQLQES